VVDRRLLGTSAPLFDQLVSSQFTIRYEDLDIVVAQRTTAAAPRAQQPAVSQCSEP